MSPSKVLFITGTKISVTSIFLLTSVIDLWQNLAKIHSSERIIYIHSFMSLTNFFGVTSLIVIQSACKAPRKRARLSLKKTKRKYLKTYLYFFLSLSSLASRLFFICKNCLEPTAHLEIWHQFTSSLYHFHYFRQIPFLSFAGKPEVIRKSWSRSQGHSFACFILDY